MELRKFIATTIREYLNENKYYDEDNEEYYDLIEVDLSELLLSKRSLLGVLNNFIDGRKSKSLNKPLNVWKSDNGRYFLTDGYHRVFEYLLSDELKQNAIIVGEGYSNYYAEPNGDDIFKVNKNLQFNGLENIIDINILKSLNGDFLNEGNINDFKYDIVKNQIQKSINNNSLSLDDITPNKYFIVCFDLYNHHISTVSTTDKSEALKLIEYYKNIDDVWKIYVEKPNVNALVFLRKEWGWVKK